jgi:3-hydroxyisobutyrate dehydrogenase
VVAAATPLLAPMTGKLVDLGPRVDAAAAFKLLGNLLLMGLTAGFCDVLGLGRALAVTPAEIATLFEHFNPGMSLPARFDRLRAGAWDEPSWELGMARKDARLMLEAAAAAGVELGMLPGLAARMDALLEEGLGHSDWTVVARDHLVPRS